MRILWITLLLAACTDPAIDLKLELPPSTTPFDLSCVSAVDVQPIGVGDIKSLDIGLREQDTGDAAPCIDLSTPPQSFDDIAAQLHGKIDVPVPPEGLAAIELRGRGGDCKHTPAFDESVFYGGAMYDKGAGTLAIPVRHNLSCDQATTYTVRPVDLAQLIQTKTCAPVTSTTGDVYSGDVRPTLLGGNFAQIVIEDGQSYVPLANGTATINSFKSSYAGSCPAVEWGDQNSEGATCINAGAPSACAQAGEIELPILQDSFLSNSIDGNQPYAGVVVGVVWSNTAPVGPVQGATVTLDQGNDGAIEYGTGTAQAFTPSAMANATDTSGMFELYSNQVVGITVTAPGRGTQHLFVGTGTDMVGATIAVLP